ncbi:MAG TPA: hypothetical protein VFI70_09645 [Nitrososphaeraceae archaeon]|nr:hypothetical protein [Nitrososphaeraceae archaeon]
MLFVIITEGPQIGATIASFIGSSLLYLGIMKKNSVVYVIKILKN